MLIIEATYLRAVLEVGAAWSPLYGYLANLLPIPERMFRPVQVGSILLTLFFVIWKPFDSSPIWVDVGSFDQSFPYSYMVAVYPVAFIIFLSLLHWKWRGRETFSRVLGASIVMTYVNSELHDIPGWTREYLGIYDSFYPAGDIMWFTPINQFYFAVALVLAVKIGKMRVDRANVVIFMLGLVTSFLIYSLSESQFVLWSFLRRGLWLGLLVAMWAR